MEKLEKYQQKRDFSQTGEPMGAGQAKKKTSKKKSSASKLVFVVQKHAARRLHYDLRLEMEGVLKSWAVPKEPSMNPDDKRLAVQTEDHPLEYATFEGVIPKGNYGAGKMEIYDSGYYEPAEDRKEEDLLKALKKGSLKFRLYGERLKGVFSLVRMKGKDSSSWLLLKNKDEFAEDASGDADDAPAADAGKDPSPMLAKLSTGVPEGEDWVYEKKYDGFRVLAVSEASAAKTSAGKAPANNAAANVRLLSRNGNSLNALFPSLVTALKELTEGRQMVLDGEVVIEDARQRPYFQLIASGELIKNPAGKRLFLRFYVFDLLELDGHDLRGFEWGERQELLDLLIGKWKNHALVKPAERLDGAVDLLLKEAEKQGWEGVIAKRKEGRYLAGSRSESWLKIKFRKSQEAVICGFTEPQGSRQGLGALVLGYYDGNDWQYLGNCGTGFKDDQLQALREQLDEISIERKPFPKDVEVAKEKEVTWVSPRLVCEVFYSEWTRDGHFRHPVFKGLRTDKKAKDVRLEKAEEAPGNGPVNVKNKTVLLGGNQVKLTNLHKVYWPKPDGYTKGHLVGHYEELGELILPFIVDSPISMHRFPNGIDSPGFYQKDVEVSQGPDWLHSEAIHSESTGKDVDYLICNNLETLLYIANLGSIEINPWLSTYRQREKPVFAVLDLDPNGAPMKEMVEVAHTAHGLFEQAGLKDFIKTSGSTGLHIYLYLNQQYDFEVARDFIQLIGELVHEEHPEMTSLVRDPKKRQGKIYLDFLQNRRGQTVVAPFSLRPKPKAPVSTPLYWEEVVPKLSIDAYTIQTIRDRVRSEGDPWAEIFHSPANLKEALGKL